MVTLNIYNFIDKYSPHWEIKSNSLNWKYCFFYLIAAYLELPLLWDTSISRKWDILSSFLEQSRIHLRTVWTWRPGISLFCLVAASELVSFWVMRKLQWCLHIRQGSSLSFIIIFVICCIFNHTGDGYSDFPTNWLNVCLFRSCLTLMWVIVTQLCPTLFVTPRTVACQAPLSMGVSRQEYWIGLPFPSL